MHLRGLAAVAMSEQAERLMAAIFVPGYVELTELTDRGIDRWVVIISRPDVDDTFHYGPFGDAVTALGWGLAQCQTLADEQAPDELPWQVGVKPLFDPEEGV